jgi:formylglycine-generating enzyme required for sulfatase activity
MDRLIRGLEQLLEKAPAIAVDPPPARPESSLKEGPAEIGARPATIHARPTKTVRSSPIPEPEMVRIEPGTFLMGSAEGAGDDDERPQHEVRIARAYGMGRYPVTFEEYGAFAKAIKGDLPDDRGWGRGRRPAINVSWQDAVAYAQWLSERTGKRYRLPSEAEWEYAARAGTGSRWSFGDDKGALDRCAWYWTNSGDQTHPVGGKEPNPWGLYDVHGNVWEWVQDCWHGNYQGAPNDGTAWLEASGGDCGQRVLRGGSWFGKPVDLRSANRYGYDADYRYNLFGFRLAQDL